MLLSTSSHFYCIFLMVCMMYDKHTCMKLTHGSLPCLTYHADRILYIVWVSLCGNVQRWAMVISTSHTLRFFFVHAFITIVSSFLRQLVFLDSALLEFSCVTYFIICVFFSFWFVCFYLYEHLCRWLMIFFSIHLIF